MGLQAADSCHQGLSYDSMGALALQQPRVLGSFEVHCFLAVTRVIVVVGAGCECSLFGYVAVATASTSVGELQGRIGAKDDLLGRCTLQHVRVLF